MHAKLLQFHENYRPAYYGTWRKHSSIISARRPWQRDTSFFAYDVDSDEEWEEEEPGESLSHSEVFLHSIRLYSSLNCDLHIYKTVDMLVKIVKPDGSMALIYVRVS